MIEDFDPTTIEDESLRQVVISLMNLVEQLSAKVAQQAEEIQRLRDENNRLKGEQGKPNIKANTKASLSSEKERRVSKPHHKATRTTDRVYSRSCPFGKAFATSPGCMGHIRGCCWSA